MVPVVVPMLREMLRDMLREMLGEMLGEMLREITFANDFDGLPLGLAAHTEPMSGCGTRPMGVRIS